MHNPQFPAERWREKYAPAYPFNFLAYAPNSRYLLGIWRAAGTYLPRYLGLGT